MIWIDPFDHDSIMQEPPVLCSSLSILSPHQRLFGGTGYLDMHKGSLLFSKFVHRNIHGILLLYNDFIKHADDETRQPKTREDLNKSFLVWLDRLKFLYWNKNPKKWPRFCPLPGRNDRVLSIHFVLKSSISSKYLVRIRLPSLWLM